MHRRETLKRPQPHWMVEDPEAPGTCRRCHTSDNPDAPVNERHKEENVIAYEAAEEEKRLAQLARDRDRMGER